MPTTQVIQGEIVGLAGAPPCPTAVSHSQRNKFRMKSCHVNRNLEMASPCLLLEPLQRTHLEGPIDGESLFCALVKIVSELCFYAYLDKCKAPKQN